MSEPMKDKKLTPKQDAFVLAYLETGNASEAYRRAYDTRNMQPVTIHNRARELVKQQTVKGRIDELRNEAVENATIDRAGVLKMLTEIATADANDLMQIQVRCCRNCWGIGFKRQWKSEAELAIAVALALDQTAKDLKAWERDVAIGSKRPQPDPVPIPDDAGGFGFDVYASPNPECPHCLGEGHVMPVVKDTRKLKGAARRLYAGFKQTKDGIEIKIADQTHARGLLAKEFGIAKDVPPVQVTQAVQVNAEGAGQVIVAADPTEAARQYQDFMKG